MPLIVKIISSSLASSLPSSVLLLLPAVNKTLYFANLSFNSTLQLINGISCDLQKYFNDSAIVTFFRIQLESIGRD